MDVGAGVCRMRYVKGVRGEVARELTCVRVRACEEERCERKQARERIFLFKPLPRPLPVLAL